MMTVIEQSAQIVAPLFAGYVLVYCGYRWACLVFIGANFACWTAEHVVLARIYAQTPELHLHGSILLRIQSFSCLDDEIEVESEPARESVRRSMPRRPQRPNSRLSATSERTETGWR